MQVPFHKSFRFRLLVTSLIVEAMMLSFLIYNSVRLVNQAIVDQTHAHLHSSTPLLQAALGTKLFERDFVGTEEIIRRLISKEVDGFSYIAIFDERGKLFAKAGNVDEQQLPELDNAVLVDEDDAVFDTVINLYVGDYLVGSVRYGVSIASMLESKNTLFEQGVLIALAEVLLTLFVLFITGYFLTRHIDELVRFANKVASGDYAIKPRGLSDDEFGVMASAFERMTDNMHQRIDDLNVSEAALSKSKAEFEAIFNSIAETVIFVDTQRKVVMSNPSVERMFGYTPAFLVGKTLEFLYQEKRDYDEKARLFLPAADGNENVFRAEYQRKDGSCFSGETRLSSVRDQHGNIVGYVGIVRDITAQITAHRELAEEKERAQVTLESIGDAVITTDTSGQVMYLNPVAEEITGWSLNDARDRPLQQVFHIINESTRLRAADPVEQCLREQQIVDVVNGLILVGKDGREYYIEDSAAPIRNYEGEVIGAVLVFHDVTKAKTMSQQLVWQATHDSLTGLLNRNHFESNLRRLLVEAEKNDTHHAMLYLDLDQFKLVNDTCGHIAGDELLRQLSKLLQSQLRETDNLARMGGDEFGVLLENQTRDEVLEVANRLKRLVDEYGFVWKEKTFRIGLSIGVVFIDAESENMTSVLTAADMACYIAKDSGRNRIHVHTPDDEEIAVRHGEMHWVARINNALEENKFALYVQKIVPLRGIDNIPHFEILLRLMDGDTVITPMAFIPAAERYNLMPRLDRWVVQQTFAWLRNNAAAIEGVFTINLSGITLGDRGFLPFVISELSTEGINPANICFEITETAAISNMSLAMGFINEIKQQGAQFALDDFGSGLSSFNYLKNLPVDYLKIDGSFVREIDKDLVSYTMVESICHVGRVMGLKMIAEFVETESILKKVNDLGIDFAQGYHTHRPEPLQNLCLGATVLQ